MTQEKFNFVIKQIAYPEASILVAVMKARDKDEVYQYMVKNFKKYVQFERVEKSEELYYNPRNGKTIDPKVISMAYEDINQLNKEDREDFLMAVDGYIRVWYIVDVNLSLEIIE